MEALRVPHRRQRHPQQGRKAAEHGEWEWEHGRTIARGWDQAGSWDVKTVQIGGEDAEVVFAGTAPRSVAGLLQVSARIPARVQPGERDVVLSIGGNSSPPNVTVSLQ